MKKSVFKVTVLVIVLLYAVACDDTRELWTSVLSKCATSDKIGADAIYFGASNTFGPGTIWRTREDGTYAPVWELGDLFPQESDRYKIVKVGNYADCSGMQSTSWEVKGDLPFQGGSTPISGELSTDLKKASSINVKVKNWRDVDLKEGVWKQMVGALTNDSQKTDILADNRYLQETSIQVKGLTTLFTFDINTATNLKAKYPSGKVIKTGDDGLSLQVNWNSETQLEMSTDDEFYIMAEYSKLNNGNPTIMVNSNSAAEQIRASHMTFKKPDHVKTGPRVSPPIK